MVIETHMAMKLIMHVYIDSFWWRLEDGWSSVFGEKNNNLNTVDGSLLKKDQTNEDIKMLFHEFWKEQKFFK